MIYFTLADFFYNKNINERFIKMSRNHLNWFLDKNIIFTQIKGTLPYNLWNGGINNIFGDIQIYENMKLMSDTSLPLRFDFSNILLENTDFTDIMSNTILNIFSTMQFYVEISNLELMNYIHNKYPNYKFIMSKNSNLLCPSTPEVVNSILSNVDLELFTIPNEVKNSKDYLQKINLPNKIEVVINQTCPLDCPNYFNCITAENNTQLIYSSLGTYSRCNNTYNYSNNPSTISLNKMKEFYLPLNINHFLIESCHQKQEDYGIFLINYFIKDEFKYYAFKELFLGEKK